MESAAWARTPGAPGSTGARAELRGGGGPATSVTRPGALPVRNPHAGLARTAHVHPGTHRGSSCGSDTRPCGALPKVLELLLSSVLWVMGSLGILLSAVSQSSRGSTRSHFILIRILYFGTLLGIQKN